MRVKKLVLCLLFVCSFHFLFATDTCISKTQWEVLDDTSSSEYLIFIKVKNRSGEIEVGQFWGKELWSFFKKQNYTFEQYKSFIIGLNMGNHYLNYERFYALPTYNKVLIRKETILISKKGKNSLIDKFIKDLNNPEIGDSTLFDIIYLLWLKYNIATKIGDSMPYEFQIECGKIYRGKQPNFSPSTSLTHS